jgi:UDP-glucose 4-epimerase
MTAGRPVVLITGANGFVGRHVAPALAREGFEVRRAVRRLSGEAGEVVIDALGPSTDWQAALVGVDRVVHLAARVHHQHDERSYEVYRNTNVEGTLRLARSAIEAGVRQFIFLSTVLVHGRSNDGRPPFREEDVLTPSGLYGQSKAEAEAGLKSAAQGHDMCVTVVRPPLIYGSGAKGNFASLAKAVRLGLPLPFGAIRNQRAFVSVQNLSSFIAFRLAWPTPRFDVFLVADNEQVSTAEFIRRLATAAGVKPHLFPAPTSLLNGLLTVSGRSDARQSLIGSQQLDISKAASIGWRPPYTLDEGLSLALSEARY